MSKRVSLRIRYNRRSGLGVLLTLALLVVAFRGYLAWDQPEAAASGLQAPLTASTSLRGYYLTQGMYKGAEAVGTDGHGADVCTSGYHMASLWEILDPANLKYDTALGYTSDDSGQGPPSNLAGWVRTGYGSSSGNIPGLGNCNAWTSSDSDHRGTYIYLPSNWSAGQDIHVWGAGAWMCSWDVRVWCVADDVSAPVYLPLILRNY